MRKNKVFSWFFTLLAVILLSAIFFACGRVAQQQATQTTTTTLPVIQNLPLNAAKIATEEITIDLGNGRVVTVAREYVNDQIVIEIKEGKTIDELRALLPVGYSIGGWNTETNTFQVTIPSNVNVEQAITAVGQLSSSVVSSVGENPVFKAMLTPNDEYFISRHFSDHWGFISVEAVQAWDITTGESSISIAIVDTGIDSDHPEFAGRISSTYKKNFIANNSNIEDDSGHGTAVAGVLAANGNNSTGLAGMNWGAKLITVKAIDADNRTDGLTLGNAISYALDSGAKVVNVSSGGYLDPDNKAKDMTINNHLRKVADKAYANKALIVAAAGNEGNNVANFYPAALAALTNSPVVAVGGYGISGSRWSDSNSSSNYGSGVDICAPAQSILTTKFDGSVQGNKWGTSIAAPFVAGTASLIYSLYPGSTSLGVKLALTDEESTDVVSSEADKPIGRKLNAYKALLRAMYYNAQALVAISSSLDGAVIYVDDVSTGKTTSASRATFIIVNSGSRTIKAVKNGYDDASATINCTKGTKIEIELTPILASATTTSTTSTTTSTTTTTQVAVALTGEPSDYLQIDNGNFWIRTNYSASNSRDILSQLNLAGQSSNWLKRAVYPTPCLTQSEPFWSGTVQDRSLSIIKNTNSLAAYKSQSTITSGSKSLRVSWEFIVPENKKYAIWVASFESIGSDKNITVDNPDGYTVQDVYLFYPVQPSVETSAYVSCEGSAQVNWTSTADTAYNSNTRRYFTIYNASGCLTFGYFNSSCSTSPLTLMYLNSEMGYKSVFSTINAVSLSATSPTAQWIGILAFHSSVSEAAGLYTDALNNLSTYLSAAQ